MDTVQHSFDATDREKKEEAHVGTSAPHAKGYGKSVYTPIKQGHLDEIATMVLCAVGAIWRNPRYSWAYRRFAYFDLHAGPGRDDEGDHGSPVVVLDRARRLGVPMEAVLFEMDKHRADSLERAIAFYAGEGRVRVCQGRCEDGMPGAIAALQRRVKLSTVFGLIYADPTTVVPWDALVSASGPLRHVDIAISLPATTEKRLLGAGLIKPERALRTQLDNIHKEKWFIRTLMGRHQFTFLLGTNYADMRAIKRIGLVPVESEQGQWLLAQAAYNHAERGAHGPWQQMGLPGLMP